MRLGTGSLSPEAKNSGIEGARLNEVPAELCHPDGESHFDEVELPTTKMQVHPDSVPLDLTGNYPASCVRITHIPAGMREVACHTSRGRR